MTSSPTYTTKHIHKGSLASKLCALKFAARGILEYAHFIILVHSTCVHYIMEGAYKNDIKNITRLSTFAFKFTIGVRPRGITMPSPYLCTVLSALCTHIQPKFQNPLNYSSILPALHPHAPK
jgi:hypothetical protein